MSHPYWERKHILDIESLSIEEINKIMETTDRFFDFINNPVSKTNLLEGKVVLVLFYENSTRTRCSFELAAKKLGADVLNIAVATSAVKKGETLADTVDNLVAMKTDAVVVRHTAPGVCHQLARALRKEITVLNAGDGNHEHPSQALLDYHTMLRHTGNVKGKKIAICGDILHSRVARSNIYLLNKFGADVHVCGPTTLLPLDIDKLGVTKHHSMSTAIKDADIIMMLRIQLERQKGGLFPSIGEFVELYGLTREKLNKYAKPGAFIMHPGPMNRAVEIASDVADDPEYSLILDQVTSGIAVRMALLSLTLTGGGLNGNVA